MRFCFASLFLIFGCAVGFSGAGADSKIEDLSWISGHWESTSGDAAMEELWTQPKGGVMLGIHRDVAGSKVQFEFLRIAKDKDGVVYYASPGGAPPTPFRLVELRGERAVFANPQHDFPQRIIYWKRDAQLCARVEGPMDGKTVGEEWCWNRL